MYSFMEPPKTCRSWRIAARMKASLVGGAASLTWNDTVVIGWFLQVLADSRDIDGDNARTKASRITDARELEDLGGTKSTRRDDDLSLRCGRLGDPGGGVGELDARRDYVPIAAAAGLVQEGSCSPRRQ